MIPAPNVVRCALRFSQDGLEAYNILNVVGAAPATAGNLVSIAAVFQGWWNVTLRPAEPNAVSWLGVDLTALDSPGSPFLAYTNTGTLTGSGAGTPYPPNVSPAISLRTGLSGRSYRGRIYHIGLSSINPITGGLMTAPTSASLATIYNTLRTSLNSAGWPLCVLSLYSGIDGSGNKIPRASGIATPINAVVVGRRIDSQRRRLPVEARA